MEIRTLIEIFAGISITQIIGFIVWITKLGVKCDRVEKSLETYKKLVQGNKTKIAQRDEEMKEIHRRLNKLDEIKIEAKLAEISTELKAIRAMLEK